jgi:hypothetical protein
LDISGNAQTKTVDVVMQRETVRLTFTDKPLPPPSVTDGQRARPQGGGIQTFWHSIGKSLSELLDGLGQRGEK